MSFLDDLSQRLGVPYSFARMRPGCRAYLMDGAVVLDENLTPERAHWAYCHEVAHLRLNHHENLPRDPSEEREQEAEANRLAAELLLPQDQFAPRIHTSLSALKQLFPHASYEVLARRRLRYRPGLLTIYDNGHLTVRIAPDNWNIPERLFPLEQQALQHCLRDREETVVEQEGMRVEGTYVDEGRGIVRVILFLEVEENLNF